MRRNPRYPTTLKPVALLALAACQAGGALAQTPGALPEAPLRLQLSPQLQESIPEAARRQQPTFLSGDRMSGRTDLESVVEGNVELRRGNTVIRADRLEYYQPSDQARARGNVYINRAGNVFEGPELELKVDSFEGQFLKPSYKVLRNGGHGEADRVDFIDENRSVARNASFTTCRRDPGPSWMPDWILRAASVKFDYETEVGVADEAVLRFKDVPILALPSMSFPLSNRRKSGWLPPTLSLDNVSGVEVTVPYYVNIAPNRDATLYPSVLSRRGFNLGGEFRYLESSYNGVVRGDWMPQDALRDRQRWNLSAGHVASLGGLLPSRTPLELGIKLNRVSDDNYWRDFPRASSSLTQRLLGSEANLSWAEGPVSARVLVHKWQILQDVAAPIVPPYNRLPQVSASWRGSPAAGLDVTVSGEFTRFEADALLTGQPNARRMHGVAQVSRPWVMPGWFVIPSAKLQWTNYQFDAALPGGALSASRVLPTLSVDSGLVLERQANYFGRDFNQTLEPRAFYTHTPYRDQSTLPNYDSGLNAFNFASIFRDNPFAGNDRIADNNLLTLGVTSRLLDPATGAEAARLGFAQRLRFRDQNVTLPGGAPVSERLSDMLLYGSLAWTPKWTVESTLQYNPKTRQSERSTVSARYSPGNYRVVNAAYRLQRGNSEQLDVGWQWPLGDLVGNPGVDSGPGRGLGEGRWYSVGRMNYSLRDRKLVDAIVGLEYDGGCWIGRVVLERLQSSGSSANQRIMFQLEFSGFSRLGSSPLQSLQQNIPRYQLLRQEITAPSRFSNYD